MFFFLSLEAPNTTHLAAHSEELLSVSQIPPALYDQDEPPVPPLCVEEKAKSKVEKWLSRSRDLYFKIGADSSTLQFDGSVNASMNNFDEKDVSLETTVKITNSSCDITSESKVDQEVGDDLPDITTDDESEDPPNYGLVEGRTKSSNVTEHHAHDKSANEPVATDVGKSTNKYEPNINIPSTSLPVAAETDAADVEEPLELESMSLEAMPPPALPQVSCQKFLLCNSTIIVVCFIFISLPKSP